MNAESLAPPDADTWSTRDALGWMRLLAGTVHRLAWDGPSEGRDDALALFERSLRVAYLEEGEPRTIAVLADLWLMLALDRDVLGTAWQVEELLPKRLGASLRPLLDLRSNEPALRVLWRPVRFARARERLHELVSHQPNLRASPAPELWGEAREEANQLLRLSREAERPPKQRGRLLTSEPEAWASEPRGTHQLLRGVKVWNTLVERLRRTQEEARALVESWTREPVPSSPLPKEWRALVQAACPSAPELAQLWLFDLELSEGEPPRALKPEHQAVALAAAMRSIDAHGQIRALSLADELAALNPDADPAPWAEEARRVQAELLDAADGLSQRAKRRLAACDDDELRARLNEVVEQLAEAQQQLNQRHSREAEAWVQLARQTLDDAVQDAELAQDEAVVADLHRRLVAAGALPASLGADALLADPEAPERLRETRAAMEAAWRAANEEVSESMQPLAARVALMHGAADRRLAGEVLGHARSALAAGDLRRARSAVERVRVLVAGAAQAMVQRLDPGLVSLLLRARKASFRPSELHTLEQELLRVRDRQDAGLRTDTQRAALSALVDAMERGQTSHLALLVVGAEDETLRPVCWWESAVSVAPERVAQLRLTAAGVVPGKLYLSEAVEGALVPTKLAARRERLIPVVQAAGGLGEAPALPPHLIGWSGRLYVASDGQVHGPYLATGEQVEAADPRGLVAAMREQDFWELFGLRELPAFDKPERHVIDPPDLTEMVQQGGRLLDRQRPEDDERWLQTLLDGMDGVPPDAISHAIQRLESMDLPPEVLESRLSRLRLVLAAARQLTHARGAAVRAWLNAPEGGRAIAEAARLLVAERTELLDEAIVAERARVRDEVEALRSEQARAAEELVRVRDELAAVEQVRDDARFALLMRWGVGQGSAPVTPTARPPGRAPEVELMPVSQLDALVRSAAEALEEPVAEVGNLLLTLATGWWTLLAGPPGVGKSSRVRRFLHRLGQGPEHGRYLELVVRREWHDDAALFGFWHPGEQQWSPSSEGLVERLLEAEAARARGDAGLFACVLEELNLAAPEHYLARPLSALEDVVPRIRLYGPELAVRNAAAYPPSLTVGENVRFLATVNVDETVERLSPRFLSRVSVLWMEPDVDALLSGARMVLPDPAPVRWTDVRLLTEAAGDGELGPIAPLIRLLHDEAVPGAPTPRAVQGIRRYLGASTGVLDPVDAQDFQVLQRVLPGLRGVGPRLREVYARLGDLLEARQWRRSAARVRAIREHGEAAGDFYDAFHG